MTSYEILPGLPAYGPMAVPFGAGGWTGAWSGHSEGFVVRFDPGTREAWVANFQPGCGGWEGVLEHPNGKHLIVLSRGQGYVVDPLTRQLILNLSANIQHVIELPELHAVVFCDGLGFEAIKSDGIWWRSPRIAWDEIRNIRVVRNNPAGSSVHAGGGRQQRVGAIHSRPDDGAMRRRRI
jgi:hypothetical protein